MNRTTPNNLPAEAEVITWYGDLPFRIRFSSGLILRLSPMGLYLPE
ncbi:hypothetical protein [Spirosoma foliorum]|uniref:Uncharacterized protein n=1 Tax=Spirosoma foliorum TaxID=2710596 RepID=A0A7G5GS47_9BACT|nr:hypothetical protein [Spirosoma foliorum]QMW01689.1 hypothetical protein H3H32_27615 [Spirosoma foliorum]